MDAKERSKKYYNSNGNVRQFHIDDMVMMQNPARINKLDSIWQGPYRIIEIRAETNTAVLLIKNERRAIHLNRLKKFYA